MITTSLRKPPAKDAFAPAASPIAIIGLHGEYDLVRRKELVATLEAIPTCDIVIIDMREVTHIDTTALACFVKLTRRLRQNGPGIVRLVALKPGLYRLRKLGYLYHIFEVFETIVDAMGEYGYTVNQQTRNLCAS